MKFETKAVHAGIRPDETTGSIIPPIYQTATYVLEKVGQDKGFDYSRSNNPTRNMLEDNLAHLENGKFAAAFSSGLSAVDAVMKQFKGGDHIVCTEDLYGGVSRLFDQILTNYQLSFTYVDSSNPNNVTNAIQENTKMIWIETPTNPLLKVTDMEAISEIAKQHGILFGVDSTFATPYLLRPLDYGADIVVHSTTKYLSGHNQLIGGVVIVNDQAMYDHLKFIQKSVGAVPGPFDCWLTLLGIKTLPLRMDRHSSNAMTIAKFLENHPKVKQVIYPGLESHPQHEVAKSQMKAFSGMITFELVGTIEAGTTLMNSVKLCALAESLGAVETMITHPATMTHADVPRESREKRGLYDTIVRLSVGIEAVDDIIDDLSQALEQV